MQTQCDQGPQVVAFFFGAVNRVFQAHRVPHVGVVKGDVVVAHQHQLGVLDQFLAHPVAQAFEPRHLVVKFVRARFLPVGKIGTDDAHAVDRGADDPCHIVGKPRNVLHHIGRRRARQQRDAVVGLLAETLCVVARLREGIKRKFVVSQLELLHHQHIHRVGLQPIQYLRQAHRQ